MAFVHPSRRALIPQATPSGPDRGRDRSDEDRHRRHRGNGGDSRSAEEARTTHRDRRSPIRSPVPRPTSGRESPKYDDYIRRESSPHVDRKSVDTRPRSIPPSLPSGGESRRSDITPENGRPWRQQENMYRRDGGFEGGGDYFERYVTSFLLARSSLILFRKGAGNSVLTAISASGRNPLMPLLGSCTYPILFLERFSSLSGLKVT
jgi:hypothetical protein